MLHVCTCERILWTRFDRYDTARNWPRNEESAGIKNGIEECFVIYMTGDKNTTYYDGYLFRFYPFTLLSRQWIVVSYYVSRIHALLCLNVKGTRVYSIDTCVFDNITWQWQLHAWKKAQNVFLSANQRSRSSDHLLSLLYNISYSE